MILELYMKEALLIVIVLSGLPIGFAALSGLIAAVMQTATQIQEQSITFAVKFLTVVACLALLRDYYLQECQEFFIKLISSVAMLGSF